MYHLQLLWVIWFATLCTYYNQVSLCTCDVMYGGHLSFLSISMWFALTDEVTFFLLRVVILSVSLRAACAPLSQNNDFLVYFLEQFSPCNRSSYVLEEWQHSHGAISYLHTLVAQMYANFAAQNSTSTT